MGICPLYLNLFESNEESILKRYIEAANKTRSLISRNSNKMKKKLHSDLRTYVSNIHAWRSILQTGRCWRQSDMAPTPIQDATLWRRTPHFGSRKGN